MTEHQNQNKQDKKAIKPVPEHKNIWLKDIVLAVINVCFIVGLIYLLNKLPLRANQVRSLRGEAQLTNSADEDTNILKFELEQSNQDYEQLKSLYPDEDRLLKFVDEIEKLQTSGTVIGFTFASSLPVVDKTKELGLPIIIEMSGSWENIAQDVATIQKLPFMFRPVTFDAEEDREENVVHLKYGGFLYVDESFKKN